MSKLMYLDVLYHAPGDTTLTRSLIKVQSLAEAHGALLIQNPNYKPDCVIRCQAVSKKRAQEIVKHGF